MSDQRPAGGTDTYLPGLDGLRAIAVLAVIVSHYLSARHLINRAVHTGRLGVILFFVLSGFLITGILLRERPAARHQGLLDPLKVFYARRAFRIFPIYYLTILLGALVGYPPIRDHLLWHLTYLSSPLGEFQGTRFQAVIHLWSLCAEEQFYFLWPWVVFFTPLERLGQVLLGVIALSVGYKLVGSLAGLSWAATNFTVFGSLDALALGALLAWTVHRGASGEVTRRRLLRFGWAVGLPVLLAFQALRALAWRDAREVTLYRAFDDLAAAAFFAVVIDAVANGGLRVFRIRPLTYVGRISYGIYLYHLLLIPLLGDLEQRTGHRPLHQGPLLFLLYTPIAIGLGSLSWYLLERPLNDLKRRFPYPRAA